MCDECLNKFSITKEKRPLLARLRGIAFRIKIAYRVMRYTTSESYAAKWDKTHYKELLTDPTINEES